MTQKHTPGIYYVDTDPDNEGFYSVFTDFGGAGAELAGKIGEKANANLFAEAPAMLEALRWALSQLPEGVSAMADDRDRSEYDEQYDAARAILSRIDGAAS